MTKKIDTTGFAISQVGAKLYAQTSAGVLGWINGSTIVSAIPYTGVPATDTAAIQAALTIGGTVILEAYKQWVISKTISIGSNTTLDLNGGTITEPDGVRFPLIESSNWEANEAGGSVDLVNIHIKSGHIDFNADGAIGGIGNDLHMTKFSRVNGLKITGMSYTSGGVGGKYAAVIHLCDNVYIDNIDFNSDSDGFHFQSGGDNISVNNLRGISNDDMVSFTIGDFTDYIVNGDYRDFKNISIRNIQSNGAKSLFKLAGGLPGLGQTFTSNFATDANQILDTANGLSDGDFLWLTSTGTLPAGLVPGWYYVVNAIADSFELSTTKGGSPIILTSDGTGTHTWWRQYKFTNVVVDGIMGSWSDCPVRMISDNSGNLKGFYITNVSIRNILPSAPLPNAEVIQISATDAGNMAKIENISVDFSSKLVADVARTAPIFTLRYPVTIDRLILTNLQYEGRPLSRAGNIFDMASTSRIKRLDVINAQLRNLDSLFHQNGGSAGIDIWLTGVDVDYANQIVLFNTLTGVSTVHNSNVRHKDCVNRGFYLQVSGASAEFYGDVDRTTQDFTVRIVTGAVAKVSGRIAAKADQVTPFAESFMYNTTAGVVAVGWVVGNGSSWQLIGN